VLAKIWTWIRKYILRRKELQYPTTESYVESYKKFHEGELPPRPKAIHQDISKFMKHGRQAKWYRASVKARKKPEEED